MKRKNILWLIYAMVVILAILFNGDDHPFYSFGPWPYGKYFAWLAFIIFTVYTYSCSQKENLFRTVGTMNKLHWGRQIGIDLYIGLLLFTSLVFFHQETALVALLWLIPILAFGNLATLLYIALHYDSLVLMIIGIE